LFANAVAASGASFAAAFPADFCGTSEAAFAVAVLPDFAVFAAAGTAVAGDKDAFGADRTAVPFEPGALFFLTDVADVDFFVDLAGSAAPAPTAARPIARPRAALASTRAVARVVSKNPPRRVAAERNASIERVFESDIKYASAERQNP
jgi:hypothetical protein